MTRRGKFAVQKQLNFVFCLAICPAVHAAELTPFVVKCEKESTIMEGWTDPLTVSYAGGTTGELSVTSEHVNFTVPATVSQRSGVVDGVKVTSTGVSGGAETVSNMPEPQALQDCVKQSVPQEFKSDPDMIAVALLGCVPKTPFAALPLPVNANITVGLIPGTDPKSPDIIVEISRRYVDPPQVSIETFPGNCTIEMK